MEREGFGEVAFESVLGVDSLHHKVVSSVGGQQILHGDLWNYGLQLNEVVADTVKVIYEFEVAVVLHRHQVVR